MYLAGPREVCVCITYSREGWIEGLAGGRGRDSTRNVCEKDTSGECVCEEGPMESETTRKRLMYTLIKKINCIQILGWDHDICNSRKERSLIHQTPIFYRI